MNAAVLTSTSLLPPVERRWIGPLLLALVAHALLVAGLTWGISWNKDTPVHVVAQAELWSALPKLAAPREVDEAPAPPTEAESPAPPPKVEPTPPAPVPAEPPMPTPAQRAAELEAKAQADIALAEQKKKQKAAEEARLLAEQQAKNKARERAEQLARERELQDRKLAAERKAADEAKLKAQKEQQLAQAAKEKEKAKAEKDKLEKERQAKEQAEKEKAAKLAQDKAAKDKADKDKAAAGDKAAQAQLAKERAENLRRIQGMAGASGEADSTGTAKQSSGPSASYAGRIVAAVRPNVVFTDTVPGNPIADVEVRTLPDGTVAARRIVKSSGVPSWDEAVLKAIDKTAKLPRDEDGRVPGTLIIGFRLRD